MKVISDARRIDDLGRIVLPEEARRALLLTRETPLKISLDGARIIIEKVAPACACCGSTQRLLTLPKGICLCEDCHGAAK